MTNGLPPGDSPLSTAQLLLDRLKTLENRFEAMRDTVGARLLQQDESIHGIQIIAGEMERVARLMDSYAKLFDSEHDEVQTWIALRGKDIEAMAQLLSEHLGSHKLHASESEKRLLAASQEEVKGRWEIKKVIVSGIIGTVSGILLALIAGLFK